MKIFSSTGSRLRALTLFIVLMALISSLAGCGEPPLETYQVSGQIVDSDSNEGIPGVTIFTDSGLITESRADGKYALTGLSGQVKIMFFKQKYGFSPIEVSAANANLVVKGTILEPPAETYQVSGRVVHSSTGLGIGGVNVFAFASGQTTTTESNGEFTIDVLSGTNKLYFIQDNWGFSPNPLVVTGAASNLTINSVLLPNPNLIEPKVACGGRHSLFLKGDDTFWAWGNNESGQLGNGSTTISYLPVRVSGLSGVSAIAGGIDHNIALKDDSTVCSWGNNEYGQLGDGTSTPYSNIPVRVSGLSGVAAIAGGRYHSVALKEDGTVWAWGSNMSGQLGIESIRESNMPVQVSGMRDVVAIAAGDSHSVALKDDGSVWAWGNNDSGQLGNGSTTTSFSPVQVSELSGVVAVAAGGFHSIALKDDGTLWAWGENSSGQIGDGSTFGRIIPVQIGGVSGVIAIAGGGYHSVALKEDGTVWAWGMNLYGQIGDGTTTKRSSPVQVNGLNGVMAVAGGLMHTIVLRADFSIWAWGYNSKGQLGDGSNVNSSVPVAVQF